MENICRICGKKIEATEVFFEEEKECEECFRVELIRLTKRANELYKEKIKNENLNKQKIDNNEDL